MTHLQIVAFGAEIVVFEGPELIQAPDDPTKLVARMRVRHYHTGSDGASQPSALVGPFDKFPPHKDPGDGAVGGCP